VRQADERLGLCAGVAEAIEEWREPSKIIHRLEPLVRQRVYQLIGGYEDANDSNVLRHDPMDKFVCDQLPEAGEHLLASQPTITRLENLASQQDNARIRNVFMDHFLGSYAEPPQVVVLDIDGWDAPTYGEQLLSFFHGYYGHHMY